MNDDFRLLQLFNLTPVFGRDRQVSALPPSADCDDPPTLNIDYVAAFLAEWIPSPRCPTCYVACHRSTDTLNVAWQEQTPRQPCLTRLRSEWLPAAPELGYRAVAGLGRARFALVGWQRMEVRRCYIEQARIRGGTALRDGRAQASLVPAVA